MKDIIIRGIVEARFQEHTLLIKIISPIKLIEGGAAMLQILSRNHQSAMEGMIWISPLQINILREPVRSNTILVRQNIPEEHNPWAIIKVKLPASPDALPTIKPAITKLMCATDE